jgi:hypothetical protein
VDVSDGLFNVMLGSINNTLASAIEGYDELYLGITVEADSEMEPRVQLGSVPFAMMAGQLAARGPGLIQSWNHGAMEAFGATGAPATRVTFNTGIDVEVPSGTTQYYLVVYRGIFGLDYSERTGTNDSFYSQWFARLVDGATVLGDCRVVQTGFRSRWDAVGGTTYWRSPFWTSWIVQLGGGNHSLDIAIYGYSDGTMNYGHVEGQSLEVFPLY